MKTFQVEGIVLKRQNIGEADRILTVLTKDQGKLSIKAIGVRKIASKRASHIEPLNVAVLSLYKGKGMPILTEANTLQNFSSLKNDLTKIGFAYHLCELVDGLCPENQDNREIFFMLQSVLQDLESGKEDLATLIHAFEVSLLTSLGYWSSVQKLQNVDLSYLIEGILERKLKTRKFLPKLLQ